MITDSIHRAQENIEEPGIINLSIACSKEAKGTVYISNYDPEKGKKLRWNQSEMMAEIFKQLIQSYGSSISEIELMVPRKNHWNKKKFMPVLFDVSSIDIKPTGEGKFLTRSKGYTKQYITPDSNMNFPFSYKMVTQITIDLQFLENIWIIHQEKAKR